MSKSQFFEKMAGCPLYAKVIESPIKKTLLDKFTEPITGREKTRTKQL